ncbi:MAG: right-handed parallel beta-helix repeat-containing protein, partial [Janthinobacterium lividum]
ASSRSYRQRNYAAGVRQLHPTLRISTVSLKTLVVLENTLGDASGLLCNAGMSTLAYNVVVGPGQFGIDGGGSKDIAIVGNTIQNCAVGINAGGSVRVRISNNDLVENQRAITIFQVETDGRGANFGIACTDVWIEANRIQLGAGDGGIFLMDGPERVEIARNRFSSDVPGTLGALCWAHSDSASISQNTWNGSSGVVLGAQVSGTSMQLIAPEILDTITVDTGTTRIDAILGQHQADMLDQVSFVRVTNGGSGYSRATVVFTGLGSGAAATTYIRDGVIIGIAMVAGGNGYVAASTAATISGDGQGATLLPFVGVPLARDRRLTFRCSGAVLFKQQLTQRNWTNTDISIPAGGQIVWQAVGGGWQAGWFDNIDYVQPTGDGSVSIKSRSGDIRLLPGSGGNVRFGSVAEPVGFLTSFGRGSPEGVVVAPPGSDYRNLNGGVGLTLWLKQTGNGSSGWTVIA